MIDTAFTDFGFFLPHVLNVVESAKGYHYPVAEDWKIDGDRLALKYGTNLLSVAYLLEGTKPTVSNYNGSINFIDYHSIMAIARSALETYLTFYYIFADPTVSDEEKQYRYTLWELSSLGNRQRFTTFSPAMRAALANDQQRIDALILEVVNSSFFDSLSTSGKTMRAVTNGRSRIDWKPDGGWRALAVVANLNERFFDDAYNLLSAVSHSDQVIANYADHTDMSEIQKGLASTALSITNIITACFIRNYVTVYSVTGAGSYLTNNPELAKKIEILEYVGSHGYEQSITG